jgi:hypothetical protein
METKQKQMNRIAKGCPKIVIPVIRKSRDSRVVWNIGNKLLIDSNYFFDGRESSKEKEIARV